MIGGFPEEEFQARLVRAQSTMAEQGLGALLLTTEADIRYFSGFLTRFWESPSRSWFLLVPVTGKPVAVIPSIGEALMQQSFVQDIRTWPAPQPEDDGVSLLAETIQELGGPVGVPMGYETHLRMPLLDFERVKALTTEKFTDDAGLVAKLRSVKSPAEIEKIAEICKIAGRAFARVPEIAGEAIVQAQVFRDFQRLLLEEGADWVPYLAGGAGPGGYQDVISPASDTPLALGDVLMLDTGAVRHGYFCDFDRNFSVGLPSQDVADAHSKLIEASAAALELARADARACDLWHAMAEIVGAGSSVGRMGHGLGMQLTEGVSLTADDQTLLKPGMVLTVEPVIATSNGRFMVHEENLVITEGAPSVLSPLSDRELPIL